LAGVLQAMGYRVGQIREAPSQGIWTVEPGPMFRVGVVQVSGLQGSGIPKGTLDVIRDTIVGLPARKAESGGISELERKIIRRLNEASFILAQVKSRELEIDRRTATVTVRMTIDPGRPCTFGDIQIRGARRGESDIIKARSPFRAGEKFDLSKLLIFRKRLEQLNVFSNVRVEAGDEPGEDGRIPVQVTVKEVPPDAEVLDNSAKPGAIAAAVAMLAMAATLFVAPRAAQRRKALVLSAGSVLVLAMAVGLAVYRVLQLAGVLPF
jgi:outer membrane translocation and assembly module TamA